MQDSDSCRQPARPLHRVNVTSRGKWKVKAEPIHLLAQGSDHALISENFNSSMGDLHIDLPQGGGLFSGLSSGLEFRAALPTVVRILRVAQLL